uniref:Uncharacterized protein n=1 Tax=Rhizophagus irregularis (strain DAOM 181602 / DAOM 197198 / MUCL 43194) TaxID=747089 RepID=U9SWI6_RHIID
MSFNVRRVRWRKKVCLRAGPSELSQMQKNEHGDNVERVLRHISWLLEEVQKPDSDSRSEERLSLAPEFRTCAKKATIQVDSFTSTGRFGVAGLDVADEDIALGIFDVILDLGTAVCLGTLDGCTNPRGVFGPPTLFI